MTSYTARMQSRLPARLSEAPAFAPSAGAFPARLATELQAAGDASVALSAALRSLDYAVPANQLLIRNLSALPVGATLYDFETAATATISAVVAHDSETPATWRYTLTNLTGPIYEGDSLLTPDSGGLVHGVALADLYPAANAYLAGIARIVGRRRGPTETDELARAAILVQVSANVSWGRLSDLLTAAEALFPGGVYLDDGGETQSAVSPWGTGEVPNAWALLEASTLEAVPEQHYQVLSRLIRQAAPAGVRLLIGALRGRGEAPFTFATVVLTGTETVPGSITVGETLTRDGTLATGVVTARTGSGATCVLTLAPVGSVVWTPGAYAYTAALEQYEVVTTTYHGSSLGGSAVLYSLE